MKSYHLRLFSAAMLSILLLPVAASAVTGSWSGFSVGGSVSVGNQLLSSRRLDVTLPAEAIVNSLAWRITLLSPAPPGLQVKLCSQDICILLDSLTGHSTVNSLRTMRGPFYFIYSVNGRGQLIPPLSVVKNELTINYH